MKLGKGLWFLVGCSLLAMPTVRGASTTANLDTKKPIDVRHLSGQLTDLHRKLSLTHVFKVQPLDNAAPSPILILWQFLAGQYQNLETLPIPTTTNGLASSVILAKSGYTPPDIASKIWGVTAGYVTGKLVENPPADCNGQPGDIDTCCQKSPTPQCIAAIDWTYCNSNPVPNVCLAMNKASEGFSILLAVGRELATNSVMISASDLFNSLEGGQLYFAWPYSNANVPEYKDKILVTKLNGDLIDRLMTLALPSLGKLRELDNQPAGTTYLECTTTGQVFTSYALSDASSGQNVFYVSLGRPTNANVPPGEQASWSTSLYIESEANLTRIALVPGINPPIESTHKWLEFADIGLSDPNRAFYCLSSETFANFGNPIRAELNNSDAAVFVFGLTFLQQTFLVYSQQ